MVRVGWGAPAEVAIGNHLHTRVLQVAYDALFRGSVGVRLTDIVSFPGTAALGNSGGYVNF